MAAPRLPLRLPQRRAAHPPATASRRPDPRAATEPAAPVRRIMRTAHELEASATLEAAADLLEQLGTRHLLVRDGPVLIGLLSDRDVLRHLGSGRPVAHVATLGLITVPAETTTTDAALLLLHHHLTALPVVDFSPVPGHAPRRATAGETSGGGQHGGAPHGGAPIIGVVDAHDLLRAAMGSLRSASMDTAEADHWAEAS